MKPDPDDTDGQNNSNEKVDSQEAQTSLPLADTPPNNEPTNGSAENGTDNNGDEGIDQEAPYGRKADGTPRKRPGRKPAGEAARERLESVTPAPPRVSAPVPTAAPIPIAVDYQALGGVAANLWFNVPQVIFGKDWEPESHEVKPIVNAFANYFKSTGMNDIPPGFALALALGSYTAVKASKPTISERIAGGIKWVKSKLFRR